MKIAIASDHGGFQLKTYLQKEFKDLQFVDFGPANTDSVDYPDFAEKACKAVQNGECERAILICGTGLGMSIAANKMAGIRAAHCESQFTAKFAWEHNKANALCLGERTTGLAHAAAITRAWLEAKFEDRHQKRLDKIHALEN
jgi:ribose 5-phosphate isomerase B